MSRSPVLSLVKRYLVEGIGAKDLGVFRQILDPRYAFTSAGSTLAGRDDAYIPMVADYLAKEPTIDVVVHDVVVGAEFVALWVTKRTTAPRSAVWAATLIYRAREGRLIHCFSEQDWASHRRQVREGAPVPAVRPAAVEPWDGDAVAPGHETNSIVKQWLSAGTWEADDLVLDDAETVGPERPPLHLDYLTIGALFTAGNRFAFHATQHGRGASLPTAGIGTVRDGRVVQARVVTDRTAYARSLIAATGPGSPRQNALSNPSI